MHLDSVSGHNQTLKAVAYKNNAPGAGEVTVETNVTGIHAVVTGAFCPVAAATYNNATLAGNLLLKGTDGGGKFNAIDVL